MSGIRKPIEYNTCSSREEYIKTNHQIVENQDGTVSIFDSELNPTIDHENHACCTSLGYTFDSSTQKCKWVGRRLNTVPDAKPITNPFKLVINPSGDSSSLFSINKSESCSLNVSFDYMFNFDCGKLLNKFNTTGGGKKLLLNEKTTNNNNNNNNNNNIVKSFDDSDELNDKITRLQQIIDIEEAYETPYVIECGSTNTSYELTTNGLTKWATILGSDKYNTWITSKGSNTSLYNCKDVEKMTNDSLSTSEFTIPTNFTVYDKLELSKRITEFKKEINEIEIIKSSISSNGVGEVKQLNNVDENNSFNFKEITTNKTSTLSNFSESSVPIETNEIPPVPSTIDKSKKCSNFIEVIENLDVRFNLEYLDPITNRNITVYQEKLIEIDNLTKYILNNYGKTGLIFTYGSPQSIGDRDRCDTLSTIFTNELVAQYIKNTKTGSTLIGNNTNTGSTLIGNNTNTGSTLIGNNTNTGSTLIGNNTNTGSTLIGNNTNTGSTLIGNNTNTGSTLIGNNTNTGSTLIGNNTNTGSTLIGNNTNQVSSTTKPIGIYSESTPIGIPEDIPQEKSTPAIATDILDKLSDWFESCWLKFNINIDKESFSSILNEINNKEITMTLSIHNSCIDFAVLLDNIKMTKDCSSTINKKTYISEPPKFQVEKIIDNKKSWINDNLERKHDLTYRETKYNVSDSRLIINSKEMDLNLSPSRAIETDVCCYVQQYPIILKPLVSGSTSEQAYDISLDKLMSINVVDGFTCEEFTKSITTELIDVKNRKTIKSYPTIKSLYDRYKFKSGEYVSGISDSTVSSSYDYFDTDKFASTIGNFWVDLIEQVIPSTTLWNSTYEYKNTNYDQQKFKYKRYTTQLCKDLNYSINLPSSKSVDVKIEIFKTNTFSSKKEKPTYCNLVDYSNYNMGSEFLGTIKVVGLSTNNTGTGKNKTINEKYYYLKD